MSDQNHCMKHLFERAERFCGHCGNMFCDDCLVQPFKNKAPLCKECAMVAAGIRSVGKSRPAMTRKDIKSRQKELAKSQRLAAKAEAQAPDRRHTAPAINPVAYVAQPDAVPPQLAKTIGAARTKRLWRAAG